MGNGLFTACGNACLQKRDSSGCRGLPWQCSPPAPPVRITVPREACSESGTMPVCAQHLCQPRRARPGRPNPGARWPRSARALGVRRALAALQPSQGGCSGPEPGADVPARAGCGASSTEPGGVASSVLGKLLPPARGVQWHECLREVEFGVPAVLGCPGLALAGAGAASRADHLCG